MSALFIAVDSALDLRYDAGNGGGMPVDGAAYERCALFAGLDAQARSRVVRFFEGETQVYKKDAFLLRPGARMTRFALVLEGVVSVMTDDLDGRQMMMANASVGDTFGESLCYLEREDAPVYVRAAADCRVLWMRTDNMKRGDESDGRFLREINDRFIRLLARRALSMNDRIQILSKGSLREKLNTFFTEYAHRTGDVEFDVPFDRDAMAVYLSANRSALSRELSAMRAEGRIEYSRNHFKIRQFIEN